MKDIEIGINVEELYRRLFAESGYISMSRSAMGLPDRLVETMQATDDERRIIDNWIRSSINEITHTINRFLAPCSMKYYKNDDSSTEYIISFKAPHNYPNEAVMMLQECAADLTFRRTKQQWYMSVKPDEASITASEAQDDAIRLRELLTLRSRPIYKRGTADKIIEL